MAECASFSITNPLKILLIGDSTTGKHCYVKRLTHNIFSEDPRKNKECDIISTKIKIDEHTEIPIQIFNISGSQRGKTKIKEYFKNIDGYIIMFDITRSQTYDSIIGWKNNVDDVHKSVKLPCILLGNKCDLERDEDLNSIMDAMENYCQAIGFLQYFEISNMNNINIEESIQCLIREIIRRKNLSPIGPTIPEHEKREYTLKIIVIGELGTGKTAIIQRYAMNTFSTIYRSTIGSDIAYKKIQYNNDVTINLHIWDIAGDERFGSMTRLFYKDAVGCFIVFDVSRPSTLMNSAIKWKDDFDNKVNIDEDNPIPCILIGNKCDLMKEGIVSSETHMTEFCHTYKFNHWYETSAKENKNIKESFLYLINEIMKNIDSTGSGRVRRNTSDIIGVSDETSSRRNFSKCVCNFQ